MEAKQYHLQVWVDPSPCEGCSGCGADAGDACPAWRDWFCRMWLRVTGREEEPC